MLTNGQVAVIDVEDFDDPCRRPVTTNTSRSSKTSTVAATIRPRRPTTLNGKPTVTGESSCRIVEPHRPRSASLSISSSTNGLHAPTLRAFPQFSNPDPAEVITVAQQPQLLATDFANPDPRSLGRRYRRKSMSAPSRTFIARPRSSKPAAALRWQRTAAGHRSQAAGCSQLADVALDRAPLLRSRRSALVGFRRSPVRRSHERLLAARAGSDRGYRFAIPTPISAARGWKTATRSERAAKRWAFPAQTSTRGPRSTRITYKSPVTTRHPTTVLVLGRGRNALDTGRRDRADGLRPRRLRQAFGDIDNPAALEGPRDLSILRAHAGQLDVTPRACPGDGCAATDWRRFRAASRLARAYTVRASNQWLLTGTAGLHDLAVGPEWPLRAHRELRST